MTTEPTPPTPESTPVRIQLRRTKGGRMPPNTVYVTRPGRWGNPYRIGMMFNDHKEPIDAADAVKLYRKMYELDDRRRATRWRDLIGKNLACWCPIGDPCHADVLLEFVAKWEAME